MHMRMHIHTYVKTHPNTCWNVSKPARALGSFPMDGRTDGQSVHDAPWLKSQFGHYWCRLGLVQHQSLTNMGGGSKLHGGKGSAQGGKGKNAGWGADASWDEGWSPYSTKGGQGYAKGNGKGKGNEYWFGYKSKDDKSNVCHQT